MQKEIDHLKRSLCHERWRRASPKPDFSSDGERDISYRHRSRTPPSETFSYEEDYHHGHRDRKSSSDSLKNDAMSKALNQIAKSPFSRWIERGRLPQRFSQPTFIYNGRADPVEHVNHFNERRAVHSRNEPLMCKVFPSSLGPMAMRWFDSLRAGSIDSFKELTQAFGSRFVMCRRAFRPLASLLSLSMRKGETLKMYSDRYWEMFNEIDDDFDHVAISIFKLGLPTEHGLRKSLTGKPVTNVHQLMDRIDKYKRVEEDQQDKGKGKVIPQEMRDFRSDHYNNNKPWRDFAG
ncbi:uncharacterized protein LOC112025761 [Quercus suber]|uniref:uncharacterized protein LOC112025761 n=1 Tax=Quercus suber TaxID=58331 RepID=UPI0032DE4BA8